jgi:hypothetical protein
MLRAIDMTTSGIDKTMKRHARILQTTTAIQDIL